jgi:hypothetical protein
MFKVILIIVCKVIPLLSAIGLLIYAVYDTDLINKLKQLIRKIKNDKTK